MSDLEFIAYCPVPSYDLRHPYLTVAPNRSGSVWHCGDGRCSKNDVERLGARWLEHLYLGDLIHAIESKESAAHVIEIAKAYDEQRRKA